MDSLFGLLTCVAILLAKILIWAPFSQLMFTFSFGIKPCPLSAVMSFPYSSFSSKPEHFVNSLSETRPVQRDETKVTVPLGEIPTSAFQVVLIMIPPLLPVFSLKQLFQRKFQFHQQLFLLKVFFQNLLISTFPLIFLKEKGHIMTTHDTKIFSMY